MAWKLRALQFRAPVIQFPAGAAMNIAAQTNPTMVKLCELIQGLHLSMLTSRVGGGGITTARMPPLEIDSNGDFWFYADWNSTRLEQLRLLNLTFADPTRGYFVSLAGCGELNHDPVQIDRLWNSQAESWFPDGPGSRDVALLKFMPDSADYWDAAGGKIVHLLGVSAYIPVDESGDDLLPHHQVARWPSWSDGIAGNAWATSG